MSWVFLLVAGLSELGWPIGLKYVSIAHQTQQTTHFLLWLTFTLITMTSSVVFLYLAQRTIPIGTAYVVWTGIGGVGTALLGILLFHEPADWMRLFFIGSVIFGVVGLATTHG